MARLNDDRLTDTLPNINVKTSVQVDVDFTAMALLLQLPFLRDGGQGHLVVDRHGLGHHSSNVARVGGEQHGGPLLGQLSEGCHILLRHGQAGGSASVLIAKSLGVV